MRLVFCCLVAAATLALPVVAHGTPMDDFSLTGPGLDVTFTLPANPVPDTSLHGLYFSVDNVTFIENGVTSVADSAIFETRPAGGGFTLLDAEFNIIDGLDFTGRKLFTGTVFDPTFKLGNFNLTSVSCEPSVDDLSSAKKRPSPCRDSLTISPAVVTPEPGSLALLGTGALGILGVLRRRFV